MESPVHSSRRRYLRHLLLAHRFPDVSLAQVVPRRDQVQQLDWIEFADVALEPRTGAPQFGPVHEMEVAALLDLDTERSGSFRLPSRERPSSISRRTSVSCRNMDSTPRPGSTASTCWGSHPKIAVSGLGQTRCRRVAAKNGDGDGLSWLGG